MLSTNGFVAFAKNFSRERLWFANQLPDEQRWQQWFHMQTDFSENFGWNYDYVNKMRLLQSNLFSTWNAPSIDEIACNLRIFIFSYCCLYYRLCNRFWNGINNIEMSTKMRVKHEYCAMPWVRAGRQHYVSNSKPKADIYGKHIALLSFSIY